MEFKDYYATLGVGKAATATEIKQAFRKLARKHHPDVNPGDRAAEARFKDINEAHEVLGDPAKRAKYDELGANWRLYEQAQPAGQAGAGPFGGGAWTVDFGTGTGTGTRMSVEEMRDLFGSDDPFSDFFKTFFGGVHEPRASRASRAPRPHRGRDLEHAVELSLEEAHRGVTRRVSIKTGGHARSIEVRIPAGVKDGARVRAAGEGESGTGGAAAGDLYLRVRVRPHPQFERKGDDLHVRLPVPLTTAVLGGEAQVPTFNGPLRLKIPTTTQAGQVFRLKGQGMSVVGRGEARGDLYAAVDVQLPTRLSEEERRHYEALAKLAGDKQ